MACALEALVALGPGVECGGCDTMAEDLQGLFSAVGDNGHPFPQYGYSNFAMREAMLADTLNITDFMIWTMVRQIL